MGAALVAIILGLFNAIFPRKVWIISQFMFRFKNGRITFQSAEPNLLVLGIHRFLGYLCILVGLVILYTTFFE